MLSAERKADALRAAYAGPLYLGLGLGTEDGNSILEVEDAAYERQLLVLAAPEPIDGVVQMVNAEEILFPYWALPTQQPVTLWFIIDAFNDGNLIAAGELTKAHEIDAGGTLRFAPGDVSVSIEDAAA